MEKIRVLVVDDQLLMRDCIKTIFETTKDIVTAGFAENGKKAVEMAEILRPDVIIMDVNMPEMDGIEATRIIKERYDNIVVLILTTVIEDEYIIEALSNGASGYILKDIDCEKLIASVRDAYNGNLLISGAVAKKIASYISNSIDNIFARRNINSLTERESEIANLLIEGFNIRQISEKLHLTSGTVKNYLSNIYSKIDASDRYKAINILKSINCS